MCILGTLLLLVSLISSKLAAHDTSDTGMDKWVGKVAVVTGTSSGIGAVVAVELAKHGLTVIGIARRKALVEELAENNGNLTGKIVPLYCDVSKPASIKEAFKWVEDNYGGVDILINNAAIADCYTDILQHEDNTQDIVDTINTNLLGVIICSQEAYRSLDKRDAYGYIININSVSGQTHHFDYKIQENVYPATKHGVTLVNEMMRTELVAKNNTKIRVTVRVSSLSEPKSLINFVSEHQPWLSFDR